MDHSAKEFAQELKLGEEYLLCLCKVEQNLEKIAL
jgi:hypothetical protein